MSEDSDFQISAQPSLQQLATFLADELFDVQRLRRLQNAMRNAHAEGETVATAAQVHASPGLAEKKESLADEGYELARKAIAWGLAHVVAHLLGVEAPPDLFKPGNIKPEDSAIGKTIAQTVIGGIVGETTDLEPGDEASTRFLGMLAHLTIQSWAEGIIVEEVTSLHGLLHPIEEISKLGKDLIQGMGLNRLARVALRPLAQILVATPLNWKYQKQFRPNLLSEGEILKAFQRGDYTGAEAVEELSRLGYSDRRQDMLLKSAVKRLSTDDVLTLVREGTLDRGYALQNLRDEGYDDLTASYLVIAAELKRNNTIKDNSLSTIVRAFVNRDISESALRTFLPAIVADESEQDSHFIAAQTQRELNVRHLSSGEVIDCVKRGILPRAFYRRWLAREGYTEEEALALELRLASEIDEQLSIAQHRAQIEGERAAEKAQRVADAAARKAQVDAERALHRRGALADLERGVIRGLIPIARLEEVLRVEYDADTVDILVGLVEGDRVAYVDQQRRADEARQRAGRRQIDVGALESAVLADIITLQSFRQQLEQRGFDAADADLLTATLGARKADLDAAKAKRAEAERRAKIRTIDLGRLETLVRRGHRTIADYAAQLAALDFDEGAQAAMIDLLQLQIADDTAARKERERLALERASKSLTLEQHRRAVILAIEDKDTFVRFLVHDGYTADAQTVLVAELRHDVAEADAARRRREQPGGTAEAPVLSLATLARAARLGLVSPATYQAALVARGYSDDDIAIEMDLLIVEIAEAAAARARRDQAAGANDPAAAAIAELRRQVLAGARDLNDYRAALITRGDSAEDVQRQSALLEQELLVQAAAQRRHDAIETELAARQLSLSQLDELVKKGLLSLPDYAARVAALGYGAEDAELLVALRVLSLPDGAAGA